MKKSRLLLILVLVFCCLPFPSALQAVDLQLNRTPVKVFFSPSGGCTDAVVTEIDQARSEVLVQAYVFTSAPIAKALLQAHRRGVRVEAILDKSQQTRRYCSIFTSLTVFLTVLSLYLFGGEVIRPFAFTMLVGVIAGSYSTIYQSCAWLKVWERWLVKRKKS